MEKIHCVPKRLLQFKNISFCLISCHGRVREVLSFFEKSRNTFLQSDLQKHFVKHVKNLSQHLSEKFIGDNLSITDIALKHYDLSIIGIAQGFFEVIDYGFVLVQKGLSCPSLVIAYTVFFYNLTLARASYSLVIMNDNFISSSDYDLKSN